MICLEWLINLPSGVRDLNLPEAREFCYRDVLRMHYRQSTYEVTLISSDHNYKNSSVIVDLAMGQIPRSKECISSYLLTFAEMIKHYTALFQNQ